MTGCLIPNNSTILLDPIYTGKAFRGMLHHLQSRPDDFHDDIVFLHSGGQFATFAFAAQYQRALEPSP
jgi:1-aminocyclopropane-1-carboxylate deaminase/D-cysteine desulfhydrase-like pyridoxal-dependent ACC family enzyme